MPPNEPRFTLKQIEADNDKVQLAQEVIRRLTLAGETGTRIMAQALKQTFDEKYGANWNCIIGNCFGSMVSHLNQHFLYFYADNQAVLLFKTAT